MTPRTWMAGATLALLVARPALAQARPEQPTPAFSALNRGEIERLVPAGSRVLLLISVTSPGAGEDVQGLAVDLRQTLSEMGRPVAASLPAAASEPTGPEIAALCARADAAVLMRVRILTVDGRSQAELTTWQRTGTLVGTSTIGGERRATAPASGPVPAPGRTGAPVLDGGGPLSDAALYEALGRPDLADATRARAVTRTALAIGGGLILLGGTGWWVAANLDAAFGEAAANAFRPIHCPSSDLRPPEFQDPACARAQGEYFNLPLVAVAAGSLMLVSAIVLPADPVPAAEKLRLLQQHGSKRVSLSDRKIAVSFNATPVLHRQGGGLLLSGRF